MATWNANDPISHQPEAAATGTAAGNLNDYGGLTQRARGLVLQSAPWPHTSLAMVSLWKADEIVMQDGVRVNGWANLIAGMAVSGAQGYLGGVNGNSQWYRVVALRRGSMGTSAGVDHGNTALALAQAGSYVNEPGAAYTSGDDGDSILRNAVNTKLSQGYRVTTASPTIHLVRLFLKRVGAPSGRIWITLHPDTGGYPSTVTLAGSQRLDCDTIATTAQWVGFLLRAPVIQTSGTQYHIVLQGDYTPSDTNHIAWRVDTSSPTYADGALATNNGTAWSNSASDALFQVYRKDTSVDIASNLPSGYDQYADIGWTYLKSSGVFRTFRQYDRTWIPDENTNMGTAGPGSVSGGTSDWWDVAPYIPPVPVRAEIGAQCSSDIPILVSNISGPGMARWAGFGVQRSYGGMAQMTPNTTGGRANPVIDLHVEYQQLYTEIMGNATAQLDLTALTLG
jgi:hypothetical protein